MGYQDGSWQFNLMSRHPWTSLQLDPDVKIGGGILGEIYWIYLCLFRALKQSPGNQFAHLITPINHGKSTGGSLWSPNKYPTSLGISGRICPEWR